jgi:hypothetical protein
MSKLGMMPHRRIGAARSYDVHNNTTGVVVIRNVTASQVVASYLISPTAQQVIDTVASRSFVDANGYRCSAHMSISG